MIKIRESWEDPMNGRKYFVSGAVPNYTETGTDYSTYGSKYTDDPYEAILAWLKISQKAPLDTSIDTNKKAYADELLKWVVDNEQKFRDLCDKYNCPYKTDYMVDKCKKGSSFSENKYGYPDMIHPFDIG